MEEFLASDIEKITDVKRTRLQQWLERGYIQPSVRVAEGHGTRNVYTRLDVYKIAVFKKAVESGVSRSVVGEFVNHFSLRKDELEGILNNIHYMYFYRQDGKTRGAASYLYEGDDIKIELNNFKPKKAILEVNARDEVIGKRESTDEEKKAWLNLETFDDIYIINFMKIRKEIDKKIEALGSR